MGILERNFCVQLCYLFKNIKVYHDFLPVKERMRSYLSSGLFVLDIFTDIKFLTQDKLDRVNINNEVYNLRQYLVISLFTPMILEFTETVFRDKYDNFAINPIELLAKFLNMEKCLYMPPNLRDLRAYD